MTKAIWQGEVVAESDHTEVVEGNHYFPRESVRAEFLRPSEKTSVCSWKGTANYFTVTVSGVDNPDAAWFYPNPLEKAANIKDHVAFWNGVEVVD
jgi:uncharacterized protein (DUF427 family)